MSMKSYQKRIFSIVLIVTCALAQFRPAFTQRRDEMEIAIDRNIELLKSHRDLNLLGACEMTRTGDVITTAGDAVVALGVIALLVPGGQAAGIILLCVAASSRALSLTGGMFTVGADILSLNAFELDQKIDEQEKMKQILRNLR